MVLTADQSQSAVGRLGADKPHGIVGMIRNPYVFMTCAFAALGCLMYGYDQGVMSSVLVMESFQTRFPDLQGSTIQGWLVSALELGAWAGALFNGWLAEKISRKYSMMVAVIIFTIGTGLQCGAYKSAELFAGRVVGGFGIGMFSMVIPLYQAEIAPPELRGSLVSLQQLSITIGTAIAFWLDYGMHFVGGTSCNPEGIPASQQYDAGVYNYTLAAHHHCLGQKDISWRFPLALQLLPAWILFFGMFFLPFSPRWLMTKHRDDDCIAALSKLRRLDANDPVLRAEYLEIKASVLFDEESEVELRANGSIFGTWKTLFAPNMFRRVMIGCIIMICQQFTGINAVLLVLPVQFPCVSVFFLYILNVSWSRYEAMIRCAMLLETDKLICKKTGTTRRRSSRPSVSRTLRRICWPRVSRVSSRLSSHCQPCYSLTNSAERVS